MDIFDAIHQAQATNRAVVLCSVVQTQGSTPRRAGSKMLVYPDGQILGTVGGGEMETRVINAALASLADGQPRKLSYSFTDPQRGDPGVCGGQAEVFVDPLIPPPVILVIGLGHVGKAVAHLASWLGFNVVVSDDRPEFCTPAAIPTASAWHSVPIADLPSQMEITPWTYILLTTRGVSVDVEGLPVLLASPAAYIGVIGSRRRWATARKALLEAGVSAAVLERVRSPMGLEINAETPEEIAVSMLAEIIALRRGGDGKPMSGG